MLRSHAVLLCLVCSTSAAAQAGNPFANQPKADDVFYHIMPIAWRDGSLPETNDPNDYGDLVGVREGLPYLDDLGVTAFWLNPIFPSPAYHGYQHGRADQINPWFGDEQDFHDLLTAAHSRDIEVYIDFVVYGISHDSPWFGDAFANPSSPFDDWLAFENFFNTQYTGYSFNSWNGAFVGFAHWDLRTPAASDLVIDWSLKWLDPNGDGDPSDGVAGYRLDHVWVEYPNGPDGWGYNLNDFWADWHAALRDLNPNVFTFAEQADWGSRGAELLPQFNAAMTKPFEFAARDAVRDANAAPLYSAMQQAVDAYDPDQHTHPTTFVAIIGDHDVDRLASAIGADSPATIARAEAAAAVLLLQPFPPIIYYGDEIAMLGAKQNYGSDANDIPMREPFKWNAANDTAPMTRYHYDSNNAQVLSNQFSASFDGRSVEEQQNAGPLAVYRQLIQLRHDNVALRRGSYHAVSNTDASVWSFLRSYQAGEAPIADAAQTLIAAVNLSDAAVTTQFNLSSLLPVGATSVAANDLSSGAALPDITPANAGAYGVTIPAHGFLLVEAALERPAPPPIALDGELEPAYHLIASSAGADLYAALHAGTLYLATTPAGDERDRFIFLAQSPGPFVAAPWAKTGQVAAPLAFVGNEADNGWSGWFETDRGLGSAAGAVLEAAFDLAGEFGELPNTIALAAPGYETIDAGLLDATLQVPAGNGDGDVDANEYVIIHLADIVIDDESPCPSDANGDNLVDGADLLAVINNFGAATTNGPADGDLDSSGDVDGADLLAVINDFGLACN